MNRVALSPMVCASCAGTGLTHGSRCASCRGVGTALWSDNTALYWGLAIDSFAILERKAESAIRIAVNFFLLVFGMLGVSVLGWDAYARGADSVFGSTFWISGSWRITLFWISALLDIYLIARLIREAERAAHIHTRPYSSSVSAEPRPMTFEEFEKTSVRSRRDISQSFSSSAIRAIESAFSIAERQSHAIAGGSHLFAALLGTSEVGYLMTRLGMGAAALKDALVKAMEREAPRTGALVLAPELYSIMFAAYLDAIRNREDQVRPISVFGALLEQSEAALDLLDRAGIDATSARNAIAWVRGEERLRAAYRRGRKSARLRRKGPTGQAMTGLATPYLGQFSDDFTETARVGGFFPIVNRDEELRAIFRIVEGGRRSVLLVGERGVGKEAILQAIAERMVEESVPAVLSDKRLLALSVPKLVAGGSAAEVAERLDRMFMEIARAGNVILAVPGVASLIGITVGEGGRLDLAEVVAAAVSKGYALILATATPDEHAAIERSALGSSFEVVPVDAPELNPAIQMVEAHVGFIEYQHKVFFSYAAVARAVSLADRYLHDQALPEKGIEILKETAAAVRSKRGERATVTAEDVALVVAEKSKIPVAAISEDESAKLLRLEEEMHRRVVGQDEAVKAIASAIRRARAELRSEKRPIANFLFVGPTGVGKTELAKTLAAVYFGDEERMIRLDMSEYQTTESLYRLIGSPGSTAGGLLTEAVRRQPFSLILLDELEKSHPDILNAFLQVMEDGRLTDATGRVADFTNAIIIATSNADPKNLQSRFRPEFLNRFDGIIEFNQLTQDEIAEVARRMLSQLASRLEKKGITMQVSEDAVRELAAAGYDPEMGARPLRRVIQDRVEDALATFLLKNKLGRRDIVILEAGGAFRVEKRD